MEQAQESGARLILLHVLASAAGISTDAAGCRTTAQLGALEFADKALLPWCEAARGTDRLRCAGARREPAQQIAAAARQFQADRLLLGTRSRSKIGKLLLGSVAEQVLRSVNLPVITVGPEAHLPVDRGEEGRPACHHITRDLPPERSACLQCGRPSQCQAGHAARSAAGG